MENAWDESVLNTFLPILYEEALGSESGSNKRARKSEIEKVLEKDWSLKDKSCAQKCLLELVTRGKDSD
jgi:hypothetical protein